MSTSVQAGEVVGIPAQAVTSDGCECHSTMDDYAAPSPLVARDNRDVDRPVALRQEVPELGRAQVAEKRICSASQYRSHPPTQLRYVGAPDRIDASPENVKAVGVETVSDRGRAKSERDQLATRDHAVLPLDEFPEPLRRRLLNPGGYDDRNSAGAVFAPAAGR